MIIKIKEHNSGNWMQKPSANGDVPPGLEYLAMIDNIQIKQVRDGYV